MGRVELTDLNPRWQGSDRRVGIGMYCDCPCGCKAIVGVMFENPLDGFPAWGTGGHWQRTGDTFDTLTLHPSILNSTPGGCGWHGWLKSGEFVPC